MANALNKVNSGGIEDGSIVNADIKSDAAIALSKLATDTSNASNIVSGTLPAARIADDSIVEDKLDISNNASDGQYLQYKDSSDKLTWATVTTADATKMPLAGGTFTGEVIHNYTGATQLPAGTTAQRPGSPTAGDTRFNSTTSRLEFYTGTAWKQLNTDAEKVDIDFLVIAGGGAGGGNYRAGGGGAGGYRASWNSEASGGGASSETALKLDKGVAYTVTVGAGGVGQAGDHGLNGGNSVFATVTSTGGGGGGKYASNTAQSGGSGGGGAGHTSNTQPGGAGTANQGYAGGTGSPSINGGGGGGGAGATGNNAGTGGTDGDGGTGVASTITGSSVTRGGGGGGGGYDSYNDAPIGGAGGGGAGMHGYSGNPTGSAGTANTGGGGGGTAGGGTATGGTGGSGVVILRLPSTHTLTFSGGVTSSTATVGSDKVYTITATSSTSETVTFS